MASRTVDIEKVNFKIEKNMQDYIYSCENYYDKQIKEICKNAVKSNVRCILLAGPSSSGKTTTAYKIAEKLEEFGKKGTVVSLDDFYINRDEIPYLPDGTQDLETIDAIDIKMVHRCIKDLMETGESEFPMFDFGTAKRLDATRHIEVDENHVVIIEGIHALNPKITNDYEKSYFYKVFISVASFYVGDNKTILSKYDIRLIRRMVRDIRHRNSGLEETLSMWKSVRSGEKLYISPFKGCADYLIDSLHDYEVSLYYQVFEPLVKEVSSDSIYYNKLNELCMGLSKFKQISIEYLPENSLLHEFLG